MIKAVFFDIDGTLLSHSQGRVPEDTQTALRALKKAGIKVFTSTGRHILELEQLPVNELEFDGYVLLNGQLCLDAEKEILYSSAIPDEDIRRILPWFEERKHAIAFVEKDRIYINQINERVRSAQKDISSELPLTGSYTGEPVYLVNMFEEDNVIEAFMKEMPHCKVTRWNPYGTDIISRESGKVTGMQKILDYFEIPREACMAFGDGENDMEMLRFAGIGIAMGNADSEVKACADYVTSDVDEGGIWHALKHFQII